MKKWNDLTPKEKEEFKQKMTQIISKWAKLITQKNKEWEEKNRIIN